MHFHRKVLWPEKKGESFSAKYWPKRSSSADNIAHIDKAASFFKLPFRK